MKVAIFGSRGFIGRALTQSWIEKGLEVFTYSSGAAHAVPDARTFTDLPYDGELDAGIFLSQSPYWRLPNPDLAHVWEVNVLSAVASATFARARGARRFLYASSGNVYVPDLAPVAETAPLNHENAYSLSKIQAEEALSLLDGEMSVASLRLFTVFGAGQVGRIFPTLVERVRSGEAISLDPLPEQDSECSGLELNVIHVDDLCRVLWDLLASDVTGPINVASPIPTSVRQWSLAIGASVGREPVFEVSESPRSANLLADTTLLSAATSGGFLAIDDAVERSC